MCILIDTHNLHRRSSASSACAMRYLAARFTSSSLGVELVGTAVAFVEHHFLAVMRPAFDERVAAEDFSTLLAGDAFRCRNCT